MRTVVLLLLAVVCAAADPWEQLAEISRHPAAEARGEIEKLVLENPGFHAARFNLGTLLLESDAAKAAEQLELATAAADPALAAEACFNLAHARFRQGRLAEALAAAERATASGMPEAVALRDELRRVVLARQDEARRKAEEEARKLHLERTPLPVGRVGEAYTARLPIAGGTPPATATLAGKSQLPTGLSLARDGAITGTPRTAGTTKLDIALEDPAGGKATGSVELTILPQPAITTQTLPEAILGQPYSARLEAVGLQPPLKWEVAKLPAGLGANADGTISGTPTAVGTVTLMCHVGDATRSADRLIDLVVSDSFAPAENPLPPATANAAYRHRVTVRGPTQEYRWSLGAGATLSITADGTLSGTPEQPGELKLPATIRAGDGRSRAVELVVPVNPRPLIQTEPIQLTVGSPVAQALKVEGGTPPFIWSVSAGTLPAGVRLDPSGQLRGVAKDPGNSTVTVSLLDRWKAGTQAELQITVAPAQDPPPQDKDKKDEDKKDQQDQKDQKDQKDQQDKKGQQPQQGQGDQQDAANGDKKDDKQDPAAQAAELNQSAADHWLDQLPDENREVLRYQLLEGGERKPPASGKKPW